MFKLDEAFEASWEQALQESARDQLDTILEDLDAEREAAERSFNIVNEYLTTCAECAMLTEKTGADVGTSETDKKEENKTEKTEYNDVMTKLNSLYNLIKSNNTAPNEDKSKSYQPLPGMSLTQDFHSFKFQK